MSGLLGMVDATAPQNKPSFLSAAIARMSHFEWYEADTWTAPDSSVALGRMGIGIFNRGQKPVHSADGQLVLMLAGEFYHQERTLAGLKKAGVQPADVGDPELALCAYQTWGEDFAAHLEGAFIIAVYDASRRCLILANDRFSLYPTYYAVRAGKFVFAPEVKGVLCAPFVERTLNMAAAAEYFRIQHLLEDKTFHEDIKLFGYGSVGRFDLQSGQWTMRRYWDWDQLKEQKHTSYDEVVEEAGRRLRGAIERLSSDSLRPSVFLSGGLDSRSILGFIKPRASAPVTATFGQANSRDVYYAGRIAQARGSHHHWFEFTDGRWVLDNLDLHLKLTEGFHSWIHMHGITMLPTLRGLVDFNLTGWDGATIMRNPPHYFYRTHFAPDQFTSAVHCFYEHVTQYTWPSLTEAEEQLLFAPALRKQMTGLAFQSFEQEYRRYEKFDRHLRAEYFFIVNHCFRMTLHMNTVARSHIEVRFPFFDYDLIDFMFTIDWEMRGGDIYRDIITRHLPDLALIPYDKKEYLPTTQPLIHNLHALSVRARRKLGLYPKRPTLYADYENYLRRELRPWAESILYDPRTEARGITDPAFVRSLMARHMNGHEEWTIGKIAPLITFEMLMREYFD